jgi:mannose-6-phosphate isomerase-like protein (cupin superfamily)
MKSKWIKLTMIILVFVWLVSIVFIGGCTTTQKGMTVVSQRKLCIIDLKSGSEYQELLSGRPQTCGMRSGRVYLQPGETCGRHSTHQHEEMLVFLAGKGTALIGAEEKPFEVGKGKISYIPPETIHNIKNTGHEPLIYIYCVTPIIDGEPCEHHHEESTEKGHQSG